MMVLLFFDVVCHCVYSVFTLSSFLNFHHGLISLFGGDHDPWIP